MWATFFLFSSFATEPLVISSDQNISLCYNSEDQDVKVCNPEALKTSLQPTLYKKLGILNDLAYTIANIQSAKSMLTTLKMLKDAPNKESWQNVCKQNNIQGYCDQWLLSSTISSVDWEQKRAEIFKLQKEHIDKKIIEAMRTPNLTLENLPNADQMLMQKQKKLYNRLVKITEKIPEKYEVVQGTSGYYDKHTASDDRAVVLDDKDHNAILVACHGSCNALDWQVNLDGSVESADKIFNEPILKNIRVHRGFGYAVQSMRENLNTCIKNFLEHVPKDQREKLRIIFTGHSQGAAVAGLAAALLNHDAKKVLGQEIDNTKDNIIQDYVFSMPRVFDKDAVKWMRHTFGTRNFVRQNVHGDPVPVVGLKNGQDLLSELAQVEQSFDLLKKEDISTQIF